MKDAYTILYSKAARGKVCWKMDGLMICVSVVFQAITLTALEKYSDDIPSLEGDFAFFVIVKLVMAILYMGKMAKNFYVCAQMSAHITDKRTYQSVFGKVGIGLEYTSTLVNLLVGMTFLASTGTDQLFESLVFGFLVTEVPEIVYTLFATMQKLFINVTLEEDAILLSRERLSFGRKKDRLGIPIVFVLEIIVMVVIVLSFSVG